MKKIPQETISRLSSYLRELRSHAKDLQSISSSELARRVGINHHQVRKDLSYFGKFGRRGVGYNVADLIGSLRSILGITTPWHVALCGLGNLGKALFSYRGFSEQGFIIKAILERDSRKIGSIFNSVKVESLDKAQHILKKHKIKIAMLTVPPDQAQVTSEILYRYGVRSMLNFAPVRLTLPTNCLVQNVDMSSGLISLSYFLSHR